MKGFILKTVLMLSILSVTTKSYAYSDYDNVSSVESSDCCNTCQPSCGQWYLGAELIYWRAFESGLDFCVPGEESDVISGDGFVTSRFSGRGHDPHFRWDPGFRIGVGYGHECSWDVEAYWTRFHSHANRDDLRWNINFDVVDLTTGYKNCFCALTLRPFIGLRGARINQQLRSEGFNSVDQIANGLNNRQKFWGVGPILGLDGDWHLGCGFSLYAKASFSWLYGENNIKLREYESTVDTESFCNLSKHLHSSLAAADVGFGVRWLHCMCDRPLLLQLGLEHHRYFDYNRFGCYGDLSFDGINLSATIGF